MIITATPALAQVGRDERGELVGGHLRPEHAGLGCPGFQQLGLGGAGRVCRRQVAGHDDDVADQLGRRQRAAEVITESTITRQLPKTSFAFSARSVVALAATALSAARLPALAGGIS